LARDTTIWNDFFLWLVDIKQSRLAFDATEIEALGHCYVSRLAMKYWATHSMRRTLAFLLLVLAGSPLVRAQNRDTTTHETETVIFCDLIRHPDLYNGKKVTVTATYFVGFHEAIFYDDACKKSGTQSEAEVTANAGFASSNVGAVKAYKKLSKFLDKYKTKQAKVTMVAVFSDDWYPDRITSRARFTLQVQQLSDVGRVEFPTSNSSKN
jgi:hypothetical protein